jgi:phenylalanine-4-hydroxylase
MLARLNRHTIEFGLIRTPAGAQVYGVGLLSSGRELAYSVDDPRPKRRLFQLERVLRTEYRIDRYQDTNYFLGSFEQLMRETAPDLTSIYARLMQVELLAPDAQD